MPVDFQRVKEVFLAALEREVPAERDAFLAEACGDDEAMRRQVNDLLLRHVEAGSFLQQPALIATSPSTDLRDVPSAEAPGSRIGPYKLLQLLGEGGMGTVWMAEQQEPVQRRVALKVIKPGLDSRRVLARFEQERQALAVMDHPNIAKVLDAGSTANGRPYFVMELVKGVPITRYCDQEHLSPRERLELFIPVCQAVQHAHQKGIIHRDLKPSNVLIALYDGRPVPKVIDFGVAKAISQKLTELTLFTEVGQIIGTLEYMAPEQAELNNLDIDTRADIYALGAILYELLTGSTPFTREQLRSAAFTEMLRMIREVEPPKPSTKLTSTEDLPAVAARRKLEPRRLAQLVRGDLDWIVMRCLEKERSRRYDTANALAMDLERHLHHEPVLAGPPGAGYRLRKFVRRNRGPVAAAGLIVVMLVTGITGTTWGLVEARRQRDQADRAREEALQQRDAADRAREEAAKERDAANRAREDALRQQKRAEEETDIARTVNEFLQDDLLGQADIANQLGGTLERDPNVTVRELLDRAAATIEGRFTGKPVTEAAIRQTLGNTYVALSRYPEAQRQLQRALELRVRQLGSDHLDTLNTKLALGWLSGLQGKGAEAVKLVQEVLDARTAKLGADHPETLWCKYFLSIELSFEQRTNPSIFNQRKKILDEVMAASAVKLGADHILTLRCKLALALLYHTSRQHYTQAESLHEEFNAAGTAKLGRDHPLVLASKYNLAVLRAFSLYKLAEGTALCEEVVAARVAKLGADHRDTIISKKGLAGMYVQLQKYDQAEALYEQALAGYLAKLGPSHGHTQTCSTELADLYVMRGKHDKATETYRKALDPKDAKSHNASAWELVAWRPLSLRSKPMLAVVHAQRAVELEPKEGMYWNTLGVAHYRAGDWTPALRALEKSMELQGGNSFDWFFGAMCYWQLNDKEKARQWYGKAVQWMKTNEQFIELPWFRAEAEALLGVVDPLQVKSNHEAAEALRRMRDGAPPGGTAVSPDKGAKNP